MSTLYAELSSDKNSKIIGKGGDEDITIILANKNMRIFDIVFRNDGQNRGQIEVMSYYNGATQIIKYDGIEKDDPNCRHTPRHKMPQICSHSLPF